MPHHHLPHRQCPPHVLHAQAATSISLLASTSEEPSPQGGDVGASHSATSTIKSALNNVSLDAHWIACHLATAGSKRIKIRLLGTVITSHYYVYNETTASLSVQRSPTSERQDYLPSEHWTSMTLPTGTDLRSASFTSATVHQQPSTEKLGRLPTCCPLNPAIAIWALRHLVAHKRPFIGPALPHRLQCSPSASCRPVCISSKRGQLCSVTWSCSDIPLVLCDCASTPHWCYMVVSQRVYTPTKPYTCNNSSSLSYINVKLKALIFIGVKRLSLESWHAKMKVKATLLEAYSFARRWGSHIF
jgi:hypothetical protein